MSKKIFDLRIKKVQPVITPNEILKKIPATDKEYTFIHSSRKIISNILKGKDKRFLIILGPCSIHDITACEDYAFRLLRLQEKCRDYFYLVMRTYFEKPRTVAGWRGLIVDPDLNGVINIEKGLEVSRQFLLTLAKNRIAAATEMVDPIVPQYIADLVSWASIGARSAESQIHRELASALSMPVGFKNATSGDISPAINGILAAHLPHAFLGIAKDGTPSVLHTKGNTDSHLILRGGIDGSNYNRTSLLAACSLMEKEGLLPCILVDCSHGNSGKNAKKQIQILNECISAKFSKQNSIEALKGCMLESFIEEGSISLNDFKEGSEYGKSITDPCLSWDDTEKAIMDSYKIVKHFTV